MMMYANPFSMFRVCSSHSMPQTKVTTIYTKQVPSGDHTNLFIVNLCQKLNLKTFYALASQISTVTGTVHENEGLKDVCSTSYILSYLTLSIFCMTTIPITPLHCTPHVILKCLLGKHYHFYLGSIKLWTVKPYLPNQSG